LRALAAASRVVELRRAHGLCSATSAPVTASRTGETRTGRHERAGELCFGQRERLVIQNPASRCPPSAVPRGNGQAGPGSSSSPPRLLADLGTVRVLLMLFLFLIVTMVASFRLDLVRRRWLPPMADSTHVPCRQLFPW